MDAEGTNVRRVSFDGNWNDDANFSPTGEELAYTSRVNGRFQIEGIAAERQFLWAGLAGMRWTHTALLDFASSRSFGCRCDSPQPTASTPDAAPGVRDAAGAAGGAEAKRAFAAMMTMGKIDVAAIEAARRG